MKVYIAARTAHHEAAFLAGMAKAAHEYGHSLRSAADKAELAIVWGWDRDIADQPTIHVETGWLPRWTYQVSAAGINIRTHETVHDIVTSEESRRRAEAQLWRLRALRSIQSAFGYADPTGMPIVADDPFILVPLQVEGDRNLERSSIRHMQELIDTCSAWDPPCRFVFRAHPARIARHDHLLVRRPADVIAAVPGVTVHQQLKSKRCRAVITISSNVAHDAMIWHLPVAALGVGPWPADLFYGSLGPALLHPVSTFEREHRFAYASTLFDRQWTLEQASEVERYGAAIQAALAEVTTT